MKNKNHSQEGYLVIFSLIFMAILMAVSVSLIGYTTINLKGVRDTYNEDKALYLAQAGVDKAVYELNQNSAYGGESGTILGDGEFSVSVSSLGGSTKRILATGYFPNSSSPVSKKTVTANVDINLDAISFNTGVQVGAGGLIMDNNSQISGNVFSNGSITGGNSTITGDVIVAQGSANSPEEEWTVQNNDFNFGNVASRKDVAQSFNLSNTSDLTKIQVYIKKMGNPGDVTVRILADNSGVPSKTILASASLPASSITGSYAWAEATFASPPNLSSGVDYWLMLSVASINASNYYFWGTDNNNGNGNGVCMNSANYNAATPVWSNVGGDCNYKVFIGGGVTYIDADLNIGGNATSTEIRNCNTVTGDVFYNTVFNSCVASNSYAITNVPGPATMPISEAQIEEWRTVAESGGIISGDYSISGTATLGPKKIDGDLVLEIDAVLIITGPIWVKGNVTFKNNTTVQVSTALGNSGTVILADDSADPANSGIVDISNNTIVVGNGNPNSYPLIMTTSSNLTAAMYIKNNSAGAIYYASQGAIDVANNAGGNQITGYKIHLNNNATVVYQSGLANATFSNGPGGSWAFTPGSYSVEP